MTAPSDADKPASGPSGAKPDASRPGPAGAGTPGKEQLPGAASPVPKVSDSPKPGASAHEAKPVVTPIATASGTTAGPTGPGTKPTPLAATPPDARINPSKAGPDSRTEAKPAAPGTDPKAGPTSTPPKSGIPPVSPPGAAKPEPLKTESAAGGGPGAIKAEPPKPASFASGGTLKSDPVKGEPAKAEPPKAASSAPGATPKIDPSKPEPGAPESGKPEPGKPDPLKGGNASGAAPRPGGPAGPVAGAAVTAGPILDLKATRVADPAASGSKDPAKEAAKPAGKDTSAAPAPGQAKSSPSAPKGEAMPAGGRGSTATPPSGGASATRSGGGFGSIAAAGLLGGVIGAGLLFAVEKAGIGTDAGQVSALDQKLTGQITALDQRVGTLAPKDALGALDKRVAAAEASAKQANEKAASAAQPQGSGNAAVPADLAARLDSLDQRVSALQEEPGRDASGNAGMGVAQIESSRQVADLDSRVKALEGAATANGGSADTAKALTSLKGEVEARTKQNADAVAALGQRVDGLQQSLGDRVKSATEAVQAATEASRKAAEAGQTQAAEASKAVDRKLAEQADRIASLDKGLADRAPASTVQAALRVVVADRIASALASGTPYAEPLTTLTKLDPQAQAQASALKPFADKGAPTASQLAETFRGIGQSIAQARRAAQTKAASETGDFRTKLLSMADGLVQVRKVDGHSPTEGQAAAPEEKVQAALDRGDLEGAATAFDALPPEAKAQAGDFSATLAARAKAAQASRTLTASAFSALPAPAAPK